MLVITGGAGFIGSNLVNFLNDNQDEEILIVEEMDTYLKKFKNLDDLKYCSHRGFISFIFIHQLYELSLMYVYYTFKTKLKFQTLIIISGVSLPKILARV